MADDDKVDCNPTNEKAPVPKEESSQEQKESDDKVPVKNENSPPDEKIVPKEDEKVEEDVEESNSKLLHCKICTQSFKDPKLLPCLHTFCTHCLESYTTEHESEGSFPCPKCQTQVALADKGVAGLPTNTFFIGLQEAVSLKDSSQERRCDNCDEENIAQVWCPDCDSYMCNYCQHAHSRLKATKAHKTLTMDEMKATKLEDITMKRLTFCSEHADDDCKIYCTECDRVLCIKCKMEKHDNHTSVDLHDASKSQREDLMAMLESVADHIQTVRTEKANITAYREDFNSRKQQCIEGITQQAETICVAINQFRDGLLDKVQDIVNTEYNLIDEKHQQIDGITDILREVADITEALLKQGSDADVCGFAVKLENKVRAQQRKPVKPPKTMKVNFNKSTVDIRKGTIMQKVFGVFVPEREPEDPDPKSKGSEADSDDVFVKCTSPTSPRRYSVTKSSAQLVNSFPSILENEKFSGIWTSNGGIKSSANHDVILADYIHQKLKVFDRSGKNKCVIGMSGNNMIQTPWDVVILKDKNMAVTDYSAHDVKIYSPEGEFLKSFGREKLEGPRGITINSKGEFIICDKSCSIQIFSSEGAHLRSIKSDDKVAFKWPMYVTVDSEDHIIMSDSDAHSIQAFGADGGHLWSFGIKGSEEGELDSPAGLCTDRNGNIVVADYYNHRVLLLTPRGQPKLYLVSQEEDGIHLPKSVAVTEDGHLLVAEGKGVVRVYKYQPW